MRLGINSLFCCSLCGLFLSYAVAAQVARGGFQYRPSSLHTALQELESPAAAMRDSAVDSVAARRSPPAITLARIRMKQSNAPVGVVIIEMTVPDFSEHLYESRVEDPLIGVGANREWAAFDAFGESGVGGRKARKRGLSPAAARYRAIVYVLHRGGYEEQLSPLESERLVRTIDAKYEGEIDYLPEPTLPSVVEWTPPRWVSTAFPRWGGWKDTVCRPTSYSSGSALSAPRPDRAGTRETAGRQREGGGGRGDHDVRSTRDGLNSAAGLEGGTSGGSGGTGTSGE